MINKLSMWMARTIPFVVLAVVMSVTQTGLLSPTQSRADEHKEYEEPARLVEYGILIKRSEFIPRAKEIQANSRVIWYNNDTVPHAVTVDDGSFDSGEIRPGQNANMTFTNRHARAGRVLYHCKLHPDNANEKGILVFPR